MLYNAVMFYIYFVFLPLTVTLTYITGSFSSFDIKWKYGYIFPLDVADWVITK